MHGEDLGDLVGVDGTSVELRSVVGSHLDASLHSSTLSVEWNRDSGIAARLFHQTTDACPRYAVFLSDLSQRHARTAVLDNLPAIHVQPCPPDLSSFEPRPTHPRFDTLDHQR